jgi:hypothetical protein
VDHLRHRSPGPRLHRGGHPPGCRRGGTWARP